MSFTYLTIHGKRLRFGAVAGMYEITPLGVDSRRRHTSAPCTYWHTKCRAMAGEPLSEDEFRFVGFTEERPRSRDGWKHASSNLEVIFHHDDRNELSSEDSAMLAALMAVERVDLNRDRLGFLG